MSQPRIQQPVSSRLTLTMRWAMVAVLGVLLISMATGQSGITNYVELKRNHESLQQIVQELSIENQMLEAKLNGLKTSRDLQLRYMKDEFGYIEPGEFVFHFSKHPQNKKANKRIAGSKETKSF
jgi:cell division protein FtsB